MTTTRLYLALVIAGISLAIGVIVVCEIGAPRTAVAREEIGKRLQVAEKKLRKDLGRDHFEGRVRLSDPGIKTLKPQQGFVSIQCLKGQYIIHMSLRLKGSARENFFATTVPEGSPLLRPDGIPLFISQWGEVAYLLAPTPTGSTSVGGKKQTLYSLHRIVRLLVVNNMEVNGAKIAAGTPGYEGMSIKPGSNPLCFNTPIDVTVPSNRAIDLGNPLCTEENLLLADVLSFHARMTAPELGCYESSDPQQGSVGGIEVAIKVWDRKAAKIRELVIKHDWSSD